MCTRGVNKTEDSKILCEEFKPKYLKRGIKITIEIRKLNRSLKMAAFDHMEQLVDRKIGGERSYQISRIHSDDPRHHYCDQDRRQYVTIRTLLYIIYNIYTIYIHHIHNNY